MMKNKIYSAFCMQNSTIRLSLIEILYFSSISFCPEGEFSFFWCLPTDGKSKEQWRPEASSRAH